MTEIETSMTLLTFSTVEALIEPMVAPMVVLPAVTPRANPTLVMVATPVLDEAHVTCVLRLRVLPSLKVPIAENCWLVL